jgi:pimeloyl-ACP methyl ester carboxylesterase
MASTSALAIARQVPLVLVHGYSSEAEAFHPVRNRLSQAGIPTADINICNYISLNNEITIKDIAEGFDRALADHPILKNDNVNFDAIVHSTGMLVVRAWLVNYGSDLAANSRLRRLKHLVGLAPATWGSPQAHKGRTWLGALVKGNKTLGPDFLNAGDEVLRGLELGSEFTWDLACWDLIGKKPFYDKGKDTPYVAVFIGNQPYEGIEGVANDPGTDGTVRWSGCSLNARKITIDLTRSGDVNHRVTISPWADNRLDVPMIAVDGKNHGTLIADPDSKMIELILDFLKISTEEEYTAWQKNAQVYGEKGRAKMLINPGAHASGLIAETNQFFDHLLGRKIGAEMEGWQQFVVHARDEWGDGISDYLIDVLTKNTKGEWEKIEEMYTDVHPYAADPSYRNFHIRLPKGISTPETPIRIQVNASTGTRLMTYRAYKEQATVLNEDSAPVVLDGKLADGTLFYPFTTTMVEILLNRDPIPNSGLLTFEKS